LYKPHRFAIGLNNNARDFGIIEKLLNGFRAGTLPVDWGSRHLARSKVQREASEREGF
jgi:hypothetical protein